MWRIDPKSKTIMCVQMEFCQICGGLLPEAADCGSGVCNICTAKLFEADEK
nr:MAG: hypothetical protein [Microviridae sp.]